MRRLPVFLLIAALTYGVASSLPSLHARLYSWIEYQRQQRSIEDTVRSTAFILNTDRWLEFPLPDATRALRVLTNAAVTSTELPDASIDRPRVGWKYAVEYELLDANNRSIYTSVYHLRTRITSFQDPETGETMGISWFRDSDRVPAKTRTIQIPTDTFPEQARQIRIRLASHEPEVAEVVARVYMKYERPNYDHPYVWSRLSATRRERISRASVYPPELLTAGERENLLRWNWAAVAPTTRPGERENFRRMYQRDEAQPDPPEFLPLEDAITGLPGLPVTIEVPATPGSSALTFYLDASMQDAKNAYLEIAYHAQTIGTTKRRRYSLEELFSDDVVIENEGNGTIEVVSNDFVIFSVDWTPRDANDADTNRDDANRGAANGATANGVSPASLPSATVPLAASSHNSLVHLVDQKGSLTYSLTHRKDGGELPFRIAYRRLLTDPISPTAAADVPLMTPPLKLKFEWLNNQGEVLRRGHLETLPEITPYDHATIATAKVLVSEPANAFFRVPRSVTKIRFSAEEELVGVVAFTRPPNLPRRFRIPEEQDWVGKENELGRTWFLIRPDNFEQRITNNSIALLKYQKRPPEANELLMSGQYEIEELTPVRPRQGRFLLAKRDPTIAFRESVAGAIFRELPLNVSVPFRWSTQLGLGKASPRLIYQTAARTRHAAELLIDGKPYFRVEPRSLSGELNLPDPNELFPATAPDREMQLVVQAPPSGIGKPTTGLRLFARGFDFESEVHYTKRFGHELAAEATVEYMLDKQTHEDETFVMRVFFTRPVATETHAQAVDRERLLVQLGGTWRRATDISTGWTISRRLFDIAPSFTGSTVLLAGNATECDDGNRCVIVLGGDLPPGQYPVRIRRQGQAKHPAYISLYRVLPAKGSDRAFEADSWLEGH